MTTISTWDWSKPQLFPFDSLCPAVQANQISDPRSADPITALPGKPNASQSFEPPGVFEDRSPLHQLETSTSRQR